MLQPQIIQIYQVYQVVAVKVPIKLCLNANNI